MVLKKVSGLMVNCNTIHSDLYTVKLLFTHAQYWLNDLTNKLFSHGPTLDSSKIIGTENT